VGGSAARPLYAFANYPGEVRVHKQCDGLPVYSGSVVESWTGELSSIQDCASHDLFAGGSRLARSLCVVEMCCGMH
jgi:hypothetical protein